MTATACSRSTATAAIVDGDELIALAAVHLQELGRLDGDGVAVTVMTNYGFHTAMQGAGIEVATTGVGDRYVNEELRRRGWRLGGEQSGHIIDLGFGPSGDGIASALLTLEALGGGDPRRAARCTELPQRLVNLRATSRDALVSAMEAVPVQEAIGTASESLSGRGRVLVRASGTEPLIRVMVEAPSEERDRDGLRGPLQGRRASARIALSRPRAWQLDSTTPMCGIVGCNVAKTATPK